MATQVKPTTKNSPPIKTGSNSNNKPASAYVDRAKEATSQLAARPNKSKLDEYDVTIGNISKSAGNEPV